MFRPSMFGPSMFGPPMFRPPMIGPPMFEGVNPMIGAPRNFGHPIIIEEEEIIPIRFHNTNSIFNST